MKLLIRNQMLLLLLFVAAGVSNLADAQGVVDVRSTSQNIERTRSQLGATADGNRNSGNQLKQLYELATRIAGRLQNSSSENDVASLEATAGALNYRFEARRADAPTESSKGKVLRSQTARLRELKSHVATIISAEIGSDQKAAAQKLVDWMQQEFPGMLLESTHESNDEVGRAILTDPHVLTHAEKIKILSEHRPRGPKPHIPAPRTPTR